MKVGVAGIGHLGKIHLKCLRETDFTLVGVYDPLLEGSYEGLPVFRTYLQLLEQVDAVIIAAPTTEHFDLAQVALSHGKHCFLEKPLTSTLEESRKLVQLAGENKHLITQVGFVERFNPAFLYLKGKISDPQFIEVHRLAQFNERGIDVSVVYDLMIHDLDLLLAIKDTKVKEVRSTGVKILTDKMDICNCRIEFEDNTVANLTASRMSLKVMRKFRIFQDGGYLSMDLQEKESQVINISNQAGTASMEMQIGDTTKHLSIMSSGKLEGNAIVEEQKYFYDSIINDRQGEASFARACQTMELAHIIETQALYNEKQII